MSTTLANDFSMPDNNNIIITNQDDYGRKVALISLSTEGELFREENIIEISTNGLIKIYSEENFHIDQAVTSTDYTPTLEEFNNTYNFALAALWSDFEGDIYQLYNQTEHIIDFYWDVFWYNEATYPDLKYKFRVRLYLDAHATTPGKIQFDYHTMNEIPSTHGFIIGISNQHNITNLNENNGLDTAISIDTGIKQITYSEYQLSPTATALQQPYTEAANLQALLQINPIELDLDAYRVALSGKDWSQVNWSTFDWFADNNFSPPTGEVLDFNFTIRQYYTMLWELLFTKTFKVEYPGADREDFLTIIQSTFGDNKFNHIKDSTLSNFQELSKVAKIAISRKLVVMLYCLNNLT